jgi:hypothetical protein
MLIDLTAKVARDAQLELEFDFGNDGSVDARVAVEPGDWKRRLYHVRTPSSGRHLRTAIAKQGAGEASIEHIVLERGEDKCAALPPLTLANGSVCLDDASCASSYCVLGTCSACGAGGCAEGSACRANTDCMGGACAAGVCRACAANGSCAKGEGCSADNHCAAGTCSFGSKPSLVRYPELDGVCGECNGDDDCPNGKCVNGQCAECATDADCSGGLRCRYSDAFEAGTRACLPRFDGILPRGALCEVDAECIGGLRCDGSPGRSKRCGVSCRLSTDCAAGEACGETGSVPGVQASIYELLPSYTAESLARVRTCHAPYRYAYPQTTTCEVSAQCPADEYARDPSALSACCAGSCSTTSFDLSTGQCAGYGGAYEFANFLW